jgi:hypothetical protein
MLGPQARFGLRSANHVASAVGHACASALSDVREYGVILMID